MSWQRPSFFEFGLEAAVADQQGRDQAAEVGLVADQHNVLEGGEVVAEFFDHGAGIGVGGEVRASKKVVGRGRPCATISAVRRART